MSLFNRITTWSSLQLLKSADLNGEFNNLVNGLNNLDGGTTTWTNVKVTTLTSGVPNLAVFNAAGYVLGSVVQTVQFQDTAASNGTGTAYASTTTTASITPKATTHKIKVSVIGTIQSDAWSTNPVYATLFRAATDLSTADSFGFINGQSGTAIANLILPCSIIYLDSPATTSSTAYTVKIKSTTAGAGHVTWNALAGSSMILLEEIAF
jgi:hypothetical protein